MAPDLENPAKQERLRKYIPYLWLAPVSLILILALFAYLGR